jgi:hypothetical protein
LDFTVRKALGDSCVVPSDFHGQTLWQGDVELFRLTGHPKAKRAHAWRRLEGSKDERVRLVAVPEIPPAELAETAVRVQIIHDNKQGRKVAIAAETRRKK